MENEDYKTSVEATLKEEAKQGPLAHKSVLGVVNSGDYDDDEEKKDEGGLPEKAWYVINTYAMRERQVKEALEKRAESFNMTDKIFRVICAEYEEPVLDENGKQKMVIDKKTGQKVPKVKIKNYYPGYIFVEMIMTDETWFVARNTPGVSGITGSSGKGAKPFPIPREEIEPVLKRMHIEDPDIYSEYKVGDLVKIITGTFQDAEGTIESIDPERGEVTVQITLFGRYNTIPEKFSDIEKVQDTPSFEN